MHTTLKTIATLMSTTTLLVGCTGSDSHNPLLSKWDTPYGTPPFGKIRLEDYRPAVERLIVDGKRAINDITANPDSATFENTIVALEFAQQPLERALNVFYNLNSAETSDAMQALALELSPMLTDFSNDIMLNQRLFARVKTVHASAAANTFRDLSPEQQTLLEQTYKSFVRSGANLNPKQQDRYRDITGQLSQLTLRFEQNLLAATNAWQLHLTDSSELAGLPESVREAAEAEARTAGKEGWLFTLHAPSYIPFMTYSQRRDLREQLYRAYNSRAYGGEYDNGPILLQIANLRLELAQLLGYGNYAEYVLEERMAQNPEKVYNLLEVLLKEAQPYAGKEVAGIEEYAATQGFKGQLMPWDWSYYTEKYKAAAYALDDEMTRPYFRLERVQDAMFMLAGRLYGLAFKENKDLPVYHPDVHAFEVYDDPERSGDGQPMAILYIDYFPRPGKQGGAWMTTYRQEYVDPQSSKPVIPIVSLVCNFTKPTDKRPSLLSFNEVTTIFHEFGHGLHGMIGRGSYPSLTGTNVRRDFVELPSQILENWVSEKSFLDLWAAHYQTGEKMPAALIERIEASKRYLAAYSCIRQLQFGLCDMAWHTVSEPLDSACDIAAFERAADPRTQLLPSVDGTCFSTGFSHVFGGGYAAGYYSYKWAEVLEADAFARFKAAGIFDETTARSFRENILTPGGSEHPAILFQRFVGHEFDVAPLLEKMGIPAR